MLELPKAKYTTTQLEIINVNVVKTEKNIWMIHAEKKLLCSTHNGAKNYNNGKSAGKIILIMINSIVK